MFELVVITFCIFINGVLAGSEAAFIATDKVVLKGISGSGSRLAGRLLRLRESPERTLSIIQVGITFVGAFAAAIGGAGVQESVSPWIIVQFGVTPNTAEFISMFILVIPLTLVSVVLGELVPKTIALRRPILIGLKLAPFLAIISYLFFPLVWVFEWLTKKIVKFIFSRVETLNKNLGSQDVVSEEGKEYIINMVKIERTRAEDVLIPWNKVDFVELAASKEDVEKLFITSGHTRLPVMEADHVVGLLNSKEFFAYLKTDNEDWRPLVRDPVVIHKSTHILKALKILQKKSIHLAVVNQGENNIGIITIEDILEEVVGDIYDEDDFGSIKQILRKTSYRLT